MAPILARKNYAQPGKFLSLPDKKFLAHYKKMKLQSSTRRISKAELIEKIERSARRQAARDRQTKIVKRVKVKAWVETIQPKNAVIGLQRQLHVPQIVVTTPEGETRWLEDPNNYEAQQSGIAWWYR